VTADRSPALRASDADREAVAQRLRAAHGDGQLDTAELDERLSAAYAAKTLGELAPLTEDLGPIAPASPPAPRNPWVRQWREWAGTAVILNAIWLISSIASEELLFYWPMFPLGIWGAVILSGIFFGDDDDEDEAGDRSVARSKHGQLHPPPSPPDPPEPPRLP
jgi:hypothetical protein